MNNNAIYDPIKRRCVVHEVLKDFLPTDEHMQALWILEKEYAKSHSLNILEYVDQVERIAPLGERKKQLRERLTKELYFSEDAGEDPWEAMVRYKRIAEIQYIKRQPVKKPPVEPKINPAIDITETIDVPTLTEMVPIEILIFSEMMKKLNHLYSTASKGYIQKFYSFLINEMASMELSPEGEAALTAWCHQDGELDFIDPISEQEMSNILHIGYLWGCEFLGPEHTDKIYARCVHEVEQLPEADEFPPSQLL